MTAAARRVMVVAVVMLAGALIWGKGVVVEGCPTGRVDSGKLSEKCRGFVGSTGPMVAPSRECCDLMHALPPASLPCFCSTFSRFPYTLFISVKKAFFVVQSCGIPVPHGTRCGSYTVP
ncbi:uncharacterized protein LOC131163579 [Malania oleifera]|uniref:uncharacterized protein LOC131163579 n=1 Tax=Malania oleifera TaxID=397392 RepID=UPI0025AEB45E|nr:uncharacterized protein LOC131163579 [Malania oleifera]